MHLVRLVIFILLYVGLILLLLNIFSTVYLLSNNSSTTSVSIQGNCAGVIHSISFNNLTVVKSGTNYIGTSNGSILIEWYKASYIYMGRIETLSFDVFSRDDHNYSVGVLLIHDVVQSKSALFNLARFMAVKGYLVILPDLSVYEEKLLSGEDLDELSRVITAVKASLYSIRRGYNVSRIIVMGVGLGGNIAYISNTLLGEINESISIGLMGGFKYNVEHGSFINYLFRDKGFNYCLDPLVYSGGSGDRFYIVLGTNDEYTSIYSLEKLYGSQRVYVVVEANRGYRNILPRWRETIPLLVSLALNDTIIDGEVYVSRNPFGAAISVSGGGVYVVLSRIGIPGFQWSMHRLYGGVYSSLEFTPTEYIVARSIDNSRIVLKYLYSIPITGYLVSIILVFTAILVYYRYLYRGGSYGFLDIVFYALLTLILFTPIIPSLYVPGRFHISYMDLSEKILDFIPLITYLNILALILLPLLYTAILVYSSKTSYYLYISYPLFLLAVNYSLVFFIGTRYNNILQCIPTYGLIIPLLTLILDLIFTHGEEEKGEHIEGKQ